MAPRPWKLTAPLAPEHELQETVARTLRILLIPGEVFWTSVDHADKSSVVSAAILQRRGAVPGLPDMWFCFKGQLHCIELKTYKGRLSENQELCHLSLTRAGAKIAICHSVWEVIDTVRAWGFPLRGRVAA